MKKKIEFKNGSTIELLDCNDNQRSERGKEQIEKLMKYYKQHPYEFSRKFIYPNNLKFYQRWILNLILLKDNLLRKFGILFFKVYFKLIQITLYGFKNKRNNK